MENNLMETEYEGTIKELKYRDQTRSPLDLQQLWSISSIDPPTSETISGVPLGDDETERIGRTYSTRSIMVQGQFELPGQTDSTAPPVDVVVRLALVLDTQSNGIQMTGDQVFIETQGVNAFRNLRFIDRFEVLDDQRFVLDVGDITLDNQEDFHTGTKETIFNMSYEWPQGLEVTTLDDTGEVGSLSNYSIHVIAIADLISRVNVEYISRHRFVG